MIMLGNGCEIYKHENITDHVQWRVIKLIFFVWHVTYSRLAINGVIPRVCVLGKFAYMVRRGCIKSNLRRGCIKSNLNQQDLQIFGLRLKNLSNFYPLDVMVRGSETQHQVDKKLNYLTCRLKG